jgi:hypothetical protein
MNIRNLIVNELADQNVGTLVDDLCSLKNCATFGVSPPATANGLTRDRLCETGDRATSSLKYDSVALHETKRFFGTHFLQWQRIHDPAHRKGDRKK